MKNYLNLFLMLSFLSFPGFSLKEVGLGEETIKSIRFPKFSVTAEYNVGRQFHAFNNSNVKWGIGNSFGFSLISEAGLLKYLNAGLRFSLTSSEKLLSGQTKLSRFSIFAKPYVPIGDKFAFYTRLGTGISAAVGNELLELGYSEEGFNTELPVYGRQDYLPFGAGFNGFASIGAEFFFTSRFGLMFEGGIRADILWFDRMDIKVLKDALGRYNENAPQKLNYMIYDFPLTLGLHIIL